MLHNTSHRGLFKRKYNFLNKVIPWVLGPFFGETPESYFAHHVGMHHPENNLSDDLSSTMKYQRDSFRDFMRYFLQFFIFVIADLSVYLKKKGRIKIRQKFLSGEFTWYVVVAILLYFNWRATFVVFVFPLIFTRFMMMAGNWGQHAFIDLATPANCYRNSITCINSPYNKQCFNDGYHIGHHLYPTMHWTDMPVNFKENISSYKKEKAIVFRKLDFSMVWFLLMTKSYGTLAKYYVDLNPEQPKSKIEIIALLKERTRKVETAIT
jgi:fatty acid desaturase